MTPKIDETLRDALTATLQAGLTDDAVAAVRKSLNEATTRVLDDLEWQIKDEFAGYLSTYVAEMAGRAVTELLAGNEALMRRYLNCERDSFTCRSDSGIMPREIDRAHPVIHGVLYEGTIIELRRKIVEAHRDLIANERILDLEDQVKSLVAQVNQLEAKNERLMQDRNA